MSSDIRLSIIVPVYKVEQYIEQCARSLFGQTYPNVEFIFVNDGTPDASMEILRRLIQSEFSHLQSRIILVDQENTGLPAARKTGLSRASGDYVLFVDSDDWLELDAAAQLASCAERTGADLIFYKLIKEKKNKSVVRGDRDWTRRGGKMAFIKAMYTGKTYGYLVIKCFKRSLYVEREIFFPPMGMLEDVYMATQLLYYSKSMYCLDKALYHYRRTNPLSISRQQRPMKRWGSSVNLYDLYLHFRACPENSPVRDVYGYIVYYTAWNAIWFKLPLFEKFPTLTADVLAIRPSYRNLLPLYKQLAVRFFIFLRRQRRAERQ